MSKGGDLTLAPGVGDPGGAVRVFTSRGREVLRVSDREALIGGTGSVSCVHDVRLNEACPECPNELPKVTASMNITARVEELERLVEELLAEAAARRV